MTAKLLKCVAVGDGFVGKTTLLTRLCQQDYDDNYIPTVFENNSIFKEYNGQTFQIVFYDTAGQEGYQMLRQQVYDNANIFLICFSVSSLDSFSNIEETWFPEIKNYENAVRILIGTKSDLRDDPETIDKLNESRNHFVHNDMANYLATSHGMKYIECSALKQDNVDELMTLILETFNRISVNKQESSGVCCVSSIMQLVKRVLCFKNDY